MPAFWETPAAPWLPILVIHIRSQVKTRQSQSCKFEKLPKVQIWKIWQETLHMTLLLKLLDKMYIYVMDPSRIVGATERNEMQDGRTDGGTNGQTEGMKPIYPLPITSLYNFVLHDD